MAATRVRLLFPRQSASSSDGDINTGSSTGDTFLDLVSSPFDSEFSSKSFVSAVIFSLVLTVALSLAFCFFRPYNTIVYAPRAKHADSKHAPPPIEKGLFGWIKTVIRTKEPELVEKVGLDAALFMRFTRMMRNMFTVLTIVGCGVLIPLNLIAADGDFTDGASFFNRLTPVYIGYGSSVFWAYVVLAYVFTGVILYFLWSNYRAVRQING